MAGKVHVITRIVKGGSNRPEPAGFRCSSCPGSSLSAVDTGWDSTSPQLWVDQRRLLLLRIHEPGLAETLVGDVLRRASGAIPVETEMVFRENGKEIQREEYHPAHVRRRADPWVFETGEWKRPAWIPK
jgi:hypothetical protein